jgi:adenylate cyclase
MPPGFFRGKIVVIGSSAPTLQDLHDTAVGFNMSGPEIHAQAIATVLDGFPLRGVSGAINVILIVLMGLLAPLAGIKLSFRASLAVMLASAAALTIGTQITFDSGRIVNFVYPVTTLMLASVGALGGHYVLRAFEGVRVRDLFSRFVPADVVDQVIRRTDADLRLGGVRRDGTVMFTDLRGFTTFSEKLEPERVVEVINHYLSGMTEAILDHGGTLVAYMGDGIMALWGAPLEQPDHADRGLAAAREMLAVRLPAFNAWLADQGFDHSFRMGIGLNSGSVMSGNVGSERRLEYTAIGDTTNTASRLEGMTKGTPHQLFVADSTRATLKDVPDDLIYVDEFTVRGREATMKVWTLEEPATQARSEPSIASAT